MKLLVILVRDNYTASFPISKASITGFTFSFLFFSFSGDISDFFFLSLLTFNNNNHNHNHSNHNNHNHDNNIMGDKLLLNFGAKF